MRDCIIRGPLVLDGPAPQFFQNCVFVPAGVLKIGDSFAVKDGRVLLNGVDIGPTSDPAWPSPPNPAPTQGGV